MSTAGIVTTPASGTTTTAVTSTTTSNSTLSTSAADGKPPTPPSLSTTVAGMTPAATATTSPPAAQIVVVRQHQLMRLYNGSTNWRVYRHVFQRLCKVNGWTSDEEQLQHLMLLLEGPAAEMLRDFDEVAPTALTDLWRRLEHRFGQVDSAREAKRRFEARCQTDTESVVEFEQSLRTLYREAWPSAARDQRDAALKRRFEDEVYLPELSQYLRLHTRDLHFEQTVEKARIFAVTTDSAKPKKAVRFVSEASNPSTAYGSMSNFDVTPLVNQLKAIEGKVDNAIRKKKNVCKNADFVTFAQPDAADTASIILGPWNLARCVTYGKRFHAETFVWITRTARQRIMATT